MTKKRPILFTDTTLRDGHQSLLATRMKTKDMLPIAEKMDEAGFYSLEVWGGATFDSCLRFLKECPWERLFELRKLVKKTKLQMLLRGQNLVGYRHYPDDVIDAFIEKAVAGGIDIFRIFDALNDIRNMARAIKATKRCGGHVQASISYTISPIHSTARFVELGQKLAEAGADSLCIKDMAGLLTPTATAELVTGLKEKVSLPIHLHSHYTSGLAAMSYWTGIAAGAQGIDTAMSPLALGSSQPATETMAAALENEGYETGLDLDELAHIARYFIDVRKKYSEFDAGSMRVDVNVLRYQIPGGMISNFVSQLQQQNALDRLPEVMEEVPRVREDLGYPPLVTPTSQMVGTQAVLNVLAGERYKMVSNEVKAYMRGLYGRPPGDVNEKLRDQIVGDAEIIDCRPGDLLEPMLDTKRKEVTEYIERDEDVISYCLFGDVALGFLKGRMTEKTGVDYDLVEQNEDDGAKGGYPA